MNFAHLEVTNMKTAKINKWVIISVMFALILFGTVIAIAVRALSTPKALIGTHWQIHVPKDAQVVYSLEGEIGFQGDGSRIFILSIPEGSRDGVDSASESYGQAVWDITAYQESMSDDVLAIAEYCLDSVLSHDDTVLADDLRQMLDLDHLAELPYLLIRQHQNKLLCLYDGMADVFILFESLR